MLSAIIPSRNDPYLTQTIAELLQNARGSVEVLAVIDGPSEHALPQLGSRVKLIEVPEAQGMRAAINRAASEAQGDWLLKIDSHCAISNGYDTLLSQHGNDALVIARRNELNTDWMWGDRTPCDYW